MEDRSEMTHCPIDGTFLEEIGNTRSYINMPKEGAVLYHKCSGGDCFGTHYWMEVLIPATNFSLLKRISSQEVEATLKRE